MKRKAFFWKDVENQNDFIAFVGVKKKKEKGLMERSMSLNLVDSYWNLLKNLSTDMKLKLISKLSDSLIKENKESEYENNLYHIF